MTLQSWIQTLGLPTLVIGAFGFLIARWQLQTAREKLRHDLYDRRFAIYMAFHDLLLAVSEKQTVEAELRKANAARAHAPFLLDPQLVSFLEELQREAFRMNATAKLVRDESVWSSPQERNETADQLGQDRLKLTGRIEELALQFAPFLRLNDFRSTRKGEDRHLRTRC